MPREGSARLKRMALAPIHSLTGEWAVGSVHASVLWSVAPKCFATATEGWIEMKFGIVINPQYVAWETVRDVFVEADELGFDSAWVCDHLIAYTPNFEGPIFEAWTLIAALAQATTKVTELPSNPGGLRFPDSRLSGSGVRSC